MYSTVGLAQAGAFLPYHNNPFTPTFPPLFSVCVTQGSSSSKHPLSLPNRPTASSLGPGRGVGDLMLCRRNHANMITSN